MVDSPSRALRTPRRLLRLSALALVAFLTAASASAQRATLAGTLLDAETGETLIGATVAATNAAGTTTGTTSDLDGNYRLGVDPGTYSVRFSYVGYDSQTVENVTFGASETVRIDRQLSLTSAGIGEAVVQASAIPVNNTDQSVLAVQARAPVILDGISAQQIKRSPDANSGEALRRVTGVTVTGGKFVTIRGVPDRYNGTLLNGSPVPSTEPDRRAFSYDLIPSNLLANVYVAKSATPDLPGDFAGGILQLNTVDFPAEFTANVSVSAGVNSATGSPILSGRPADLPASLPSNLGLATVTDDQRAAVGRELAGGFALDRETGTVRPNVNVSVGGSSETAIGRIGAIGAVSYRSGYSSNDVTRREFEASGESRFDLGGIQAGYGETAGGLLNLAWRPTPTQSLSFKNFYNRTVEDDVTQLSGQRQSDLGADVQQTAVRHSERTLYSGQLQGQHFFPAANRAEIGWTLFGANTTRDEPDYRRLTYFRQIGADPADPFQLLVGPTVSINNGGRFFSNLDETSLGGLLDLSAYAGSARFKTGLWLERRDRDFSSRLIAVTQPTRDFDFGLLALPMDQIFAAQNFGRLNKPGCEDGGRGCEGFLFNELQNGGNNYTAAQDVTAGYVMVDTPVTPISRQLRFVGGLRVERSIQRLESTTFNRDSLSIRSPYTSLLPSVNLSYALGQATNLRFAYSRNLNRPELRELAPFQFYDFELQTTIYGNDSLRQASINNFDLRFETFPGPGQILSASVFYKRFTDPIERAIVPGVSLNAERSFVNATSADNYGFEIEARYGLGFAAEMLRASSVVLNYTRIESNVNQPATLLAAARTGRPLQGQAPYVINAGLNLVSEKYGTAFTALYNRLGSRIIEVSSILEDDVVDAPRDLIDLSLSQPVLSRYTLRLNVRDLLGQNQNAMQGANVIRGDLRGRSVSFGVSASL